MESTKATEEKLSSDDSNSITDKTLSNSDINDKLHDTSITKSDSDTEYSHVLLLLPPPPQLPPDSSSILQEPILLDITPVTSRSKAGNESDEFLLYSDSDVASQSSLDVNTHTPRQQKDSLSPRTILSRRNQSISSEEDDEDEDARLAFLSPPRVKPRRKSRKGSTTSGESPSTPNSNSTKKPRRSSRGRRGSGDSDSVAMASGTTTSRKPKKRIRRKSKDVIAPSERSHRSEFYGTGYTSMPASGKIFRNLLILEESLREQVIQQRAMRRKYLTFLSILCSIIASIVHHLFILDSGLSSTGTQRVILQFLLFITIITLLLYHLSGEYQKTIVVPRKFLSSTNKGLRQLNVRLVKIKTPFIDKVTDLIREILLYIVNINLDFFHKLSPMSIQNRNSKIEVFLVGCQSQCQPRIGVTDVKLVLNPRMFNTDIREGWELYRNEFWVKEGVRRRNNMMKFTIPETVKSKVIKRRKRRSSTPVISINERVSGTLSEENLQKLRNGFEFNQEKILKNSVIAEEEGEEEEILSEDISSTGT